MLNIGTTKNISFPFGTDGKLIALGVPMLKHFRAPGVLIVLELF